MPRRAARGSRNGRGWVRDRGADVAGGAEAGVAAPDAVAADRLGGRGRDVPVRGGAGAAGGRARGDGGDGRGYHAGGLPREPVLPRDQQASGAVRGPDREGGGRGLGDPDED